MSNLEAFRITSSPPLSFLKQNPFLSDLLLADCNYDLSEVAALIEPLLQAPNRCERTGLYIQAVTTGYTAFLATNLIEHRIAEVTPLSSSWLLGRSPACAIPLPHGSVSRRHAAIGHHPWGGFYITDLGSLNGTRLNRRRLQPNQRSILKDGDLIQFGVLQVEFFLTQRLHEPLHEHSSAEHSSTKHNSAKHNSAKHNSESSSPEHSSAKHSS